ncbi:MAG: Gfo/Idh/MocA family oxidoreductase [Planctomycetota bacterium]|nr:Gfo/Idh/MocA family oxidoreductase [Planctomycetota bacterium]
MPLRLAMLGMWHTHADGMVRQICAHPEEFSLVGFHDPDPQVVAQRTAQWSDLVPGFRLFDSPAELLRQPLDGVLVEGRVSSNVGFARQAIESGFPVLLEKPAGITLNEFVALVDSARSRRLHLQMAYLFRYMSAVQELLARHQRGDLGAIYLFRGRLPKDLALYSQLVEELGVYRGGVFFEMAGHLIDLAVALAGTPRRVTSFLRHHHTAGPADYIDNGLAVIEFDRALAEIDITGLEVAPSSRRIEVFGTGGAAVIPHLGSGHLANNAVQPIEICRAGDSEWTTFKPAAATLQIKDLREFANVVNGNKSPSFTLDHDLVVQETLLRASEMLDSTQN